MRTGFLTVLVLLFAFKAIESDAYNYEYLKGCNPRVSVILDSLEKAMLADFNGMRSIKSTLLDSLKVSKDIEHAGIESRYKRFKDGGNDVFKLAGPFHDLVPDPNARYKVTSGSEIPTDTLAKTVLDDIRMMAQVIEIRYKANRNQDGTPAKELLKKLAQKVNSDRTRTVRTKHNLEKLYKAFDDDSNGKLENIGKYFTEQLLLHRETSSSRSKRLREQRDAVLPYARQDNGEESRLARDLENSLHKNAGVAADLSESIIRVKYSLDDLFEKELKVWCTLEETHLSRIKGWSSQSVADAERQAEEYVPKATSN